MTPHKCPCPTLNSSGTNSGGGHAARLDVLTITSGGILALAGNNVLNAGQIGLPPAPCSYGRPTRRPR